MNRVRFLKKITLAASVSLAMAFAISCSDDKDKDKDDKTPYCTVYGSCYEITGTNNNTKDLCTTMGGTVSNGKPEECEEE